MLDLLKSMPGFNAKIGLEMLAQHLIKNVGHSLDVFQARFFIEKNVMEFLVYWPENKVIPLKFGQYQHEGINVTTGFGRELIPPKTHVYVMKLEDDAKGLITDLVADQVEIEFTGTVDYIILDVDRNKSRFPFKVYYTLEGQKLMKKGELK